MASCKILCKPKNKNTAPAKLKNCHDNVGIIFVVIVVLVVVVVEVIVVVVVFYQSPKINNRRRKGVFSRRMNERMNE